MQIENLKHPDTLLESRHLAAEKYQPENIHLLLVAEAPPRDENRYFYFEKVSKQDSLFRYVVRSVLNIEPIQEHKINHLNALKEAGIFLIDLVKNPLGPKDRLKDIADLTSLTSRCLNLRPERIILIKTTVYDIAFTQLKNAGLPVIDERIPFPGSGQQPRFVRAFGRALTKI